VTTPRRGACLRNIFQKFNADDLFHYDIP